MVKPTFMADISGHLTLDKQAFNSRPLKGFVRVDERRKNRAERIMNIASIEHVGPNSWRVLTATGLGVFIGTLDQCVEFCKEHMEDA